MIKYSEEKNIGILTLNRPEKRNALNPELIEAIKNKINSIEKDNKIKVLIITGEGSSFCSGADLEYLNKLTNYSAAENEKDSELISELFLSIYNYSIPTIAAVNGPAIAGGCGLATVCDFVVADSAKAKFGYTEVKIGFIPAIVSIFLIKKIGEGGARRLLLSGEIINSQKAHEIGLVDYVSIDVLKESFSLAEKISGNSLSSFKETKKLISSISSLSIEEAVEYASGINTVSRSANDFKEGLKNFLNKK